MGELLVRGRDIPAPRKLPHITKEAEKNILVWQKYLAGISERLTVFSIFDKEFQPYFEKNGMVSIDLLEDPENMSLSPSRYKPFPLIIIVPKEKEWLLSKTEYFQYALFCSRRGAMAAPWDVNYDLEVNGDIYIYFRSYREVSNNIVRMMRRAEKIVPKPRKS